MFHPYGGWCLLWQRPSYQLVDTGSEGRCPTEESYSVLSPAWPFWPVDLQNGTLPRRPQWPKLRRSWMRPWGFPDSLKKTLTHHEGEAVHANTMRYSQSLKSYWWSHHQRCKTCGGHVSRASSEQQRRGFLLVSSASVWGIWRPDAGSLFSVSPLQELTLNLDQRSCTLPMLPFVTNSIHHLYGQNFEGQPERWWGLVWWPENWVRPDRWMDSWRDAAAVTNSISSLRSSSQEL